MKMKMTILITVKKIITALLSLGLVVVSNVVEDVPAAREARDGGVLVARMVDLHHTIAADLEVEAGLLELADAWERARERRRGALVGDIVLAELEIRGILEQLEALAVNVAGNTVVRLVREPLERKAAARAVLEHIAVHGTLGRELVDVGVHVLDLLGHKLHHIGSRVERSQTHIAAKGALARNLVERALRVLNHRRLHRRRNREVVALLLGMGRELGMEAAHDLIHGLVAENDRVDRIVRQTRVANLAKRGQLPRIHTTSADARMLVCGVDPVDRALAQHIELASAHKLVNADAGNRRVLFIADEDGHHRDLELGLLLGKLGHEISDHRNVTKTVGGAAAVQLVAFDSQLERVLLPLGRVGSHHIHVRADKTNGLRALAGVRDEQIRAARGVRALLDLERTAVFSGKRLQDIEHMLHNAVLLGHKVRRVVLNILGLANKLLQKREETRLVHR
eukprot:comp21280_c0_seq2/m.45580 comp21280_c0_seq2/g.45580  ORF comp21280_c0_seq2/g.45580 comp21280_c0_seq2/m.45580 type:complete len:453 (+) comp21280_c0_seq2:297-1655(+)